MSAATYWTREERETMAQWAKFDDLPELKQGEALRILVTVNALEKALSRLTAKYHDKYGTEIEVLVDDEYGFCLLCNGGDVAHALDCPLIEARALLAALEGKSDRQNAETVARAATARLQEKP